MRNKDAEYYDEFSPQYIQPEVEEMPIHIGGEEYLYSLLRDQIGEPEDLYSLQLTGIVVVSFEVSEQGTIENPNLELGFHPRYNELVLSALKNIEPSWVPAKNEGVYVSCRRSIEVYFFYKVEMIAPNSLLRYS